MIIELRLNLKVTSKQSARFVETDSKNRGSFIGKSIKAAQYQQEISMNKSKKKITVLQSERIKVKQKEYAWLIKTQLPKKFICSSAPIIVHQVTYIFAAGMSSAGVKIEGYADIFKPSVPDLPDNMNKMLFDAMKGLVYDDDRQIVFIGEQKKVWGDNNLIYVKLEVVENYEQVYVSGSKKL